MTVLFRQQVDPMPPAPLTVITHGSFDIISHGGFQPPGVPPDWTATMQQALRARGVVDAVIMDWSAVSDLFNAGWAEAAGDELFARILWQAQQRNTPFDLHFIGHSRGTVVNSVAGERLAYYEDTIPAFRQQIARVQVTWLDAHPAGPIFVGASGVPLLVDLDRAVEPLFQDPAPQIWNNVTWADVHWQRTPHRACAAIHGGHFTDIFVNPWGMTASQAYNEDRTGTLCHFDFGDWYTGTITSNDAQHGGYYYALAGAGWEERPAPRDPVGIPPAPPEGVFNGDFRYGGEAIPLPFPFRALAGSGRIPGWSGHGFLVTPSRALRLQVPMIPPLSPEASIVHNPLFLPPGASALQFDVTDWGGRDPATLTVCFVPVELSFSGGLELDVLHRQVLLTWDLLGSGRGENSDRSSGRTPRRQTIDLASVLRSGPLGTVGSFQFELRVPNPMTGLLSGAFVDLAHVAVVRPGSGPS